MEDKNKKKSDHDEESDWNSYVSDHEQFKEEIKPKRLILPGTRVL